MASGEAVSRLEEFDKDLQNESVDPLETLRLLDRFGSPATTATVSGRYFGFVIGGILPAALGARILASAWDQVVSVDVTSPVGVKLEEVASKWLLDVLRLPDSSSVGFVTGATMANFTCLAAARHSILKNQNWDVETKGLWDAPRLRVVAGKQAHVTVLKALSMLGIGTEVIEWIDCDEQGRIRVDQLPDTDNNTMILTQAGNINSGASDPIADICARSNGAWVHVDGAFGLWAAASHTTREQLAGYESADSWVVDGHKWLNTAYDCGIAICKHPEAVHAVMATQALYLKVGSTAAPKDMVPEFSRSARGVEVWSALHSLGKQGLNDLIDRSCNHTRKLAEGLEGLGFEILNDVVLNQVVATIEGKEDKMPEIAGHVQASGKAWFGPTNWRGRSAIRFSVCCWATTTLDITETLQAVSDAKEAIL